MRCTQCVLTDSVPGSCFDSQGVCVWCREGYPNYKPRGKEALSQLIRQKQRPGAVVDCVVPVSGGKDSSFALWAMKKHFGLRVHAFTYDHDSAAPFARANAKAVCDSLDVPLTVGSLGPGEHLKSFQDFFAAWVKKPSPVSAAMVCSACKNLNLIGTSLAAKLQAPMVVWASSPLEAPPFLALKLTGEGTKREGLMKGAAILGKEVLTSPHLLHAIARQLGVTAQGCLSMSPTSPYLKWRYGSVSPVMFFEYWPWNRDEIYEVLSRETAWKRPGENDWHTDCDLHALKEYVFQSMLGVSYTDGYLSNQIRAGLLQREEAMRILAQGKKHVAETLDEALAMAGLGHLSDRIDRSCLTFQA